MSPPDPLMDVLPLDLQQASVAHQLEYLRNRRNDVLRVISVLERLSVARSASSHSGRPRRTPRAAA